MIESTESKQVYTVTQRENPGVFAFPIRFWNSDEIVVAIGGTSTFSEVRLTGGTEFDVTGSDYAQGGTVTLHYGTGKLPALSAMLGKSVTVARELPLTQTLTLPTHGVLPSEELEGELDKIICIIQQHDEEINRCIKAPLGSGVSSDEYMQYFLQQINLSVQSCVYSAESAAASAVNSAAVAAFVGNCMTEITGNTSYAEKAAASFYNVEKQYGAVIASGTATLLAVTGDGINAVTLAGQTETVALQQESLSQQESIAGVGGTYTAKIAQAEGQMDVYLAGCSAAANYAGDSAVEIQGMSTSLRQMKDQLDVSVAEALEAGTVCIVQAGSSSYYMQQSQAALRDAQAALSGCTTSEGNASASAASALSKAGEAATSASNALARAGEAAQSAANAYAAELAAGTVAEQTANSCITAHNEAPAAHPNGFNHSISVTGDITATGSTARVIAKSGTFTDGVSIGGGLALGGAISATSGTFSGAISATSGTFSGAIMVQSSVSNSIVIKNIDYTDTTTGLDYYTGAWATGSDGFLTGGWESVKGSDGSNRSQLVTRIPDSHPSTYAHLILSSTSDGKSTISSPGVFTDCDANTQVVGNTSTKIATTAFVQAAVAAAGGTSKQGKPDYSAAVGISFAGGSIYIFTSDGWFEWYGPTSSYHRAVVLCPGGTLTSDTALRIGQIHDTAPSGIVPVNAGDGVTIVSAVDITSIVDSSFDYAKFIPNK